MRHLSLFFVLVNISLRLLAQNAYTLSSSDTFQTVTGLAILEDKNYSIEQIATDTTLPFKPVLLNDSVRTSDFNAFWYKITIHNPSAYSEKYQVRCFPMADNTVYYFNQNEKKWLSGRAGSSVNNNKWGWFDAFCNLQGNATQTLYAKSDLSTLKNLRTSFNPAVSLFKAELVEKRQQNSKTPIYITVLIVGVFFLYNAYVYVIFRDKTYFYYLLTQIGGVLYLLSMSNYLNVLLNFRFVRYEARDPSGGGGFNIWDLNQICISVALIILFSGFIQLTRYYLNTRQLLPKQDVVLKYLLYGFPAVLMPVNILISTGTTKLISLNSTVINVFAIFTIGFVFYIAFLSFKKQFKAAKYFLMANAISLAIIIFLGVYYLFFRSDNAANFIILPSIAVIAQAICLAIALIERILIIREELKQKQLEAQELASQNEQMGLKNQVIALENESIKTENLLQKTQNDLLQQKLESNQRELASATLYVYQKNELLADLKTHVQLLTKTLPESAKLNFQPIETVIQNNLYLDSDWERFKIHLEQVHPDFFDNLKKEHPSLTNNEIRLCAYFHINLSTKEIASLLNIDPASVRTAKMRLNKKMEV